jgi:L-ribulose-5-phosphate 3-epimerase
MYFGYNTNGFAHHRLEDAISILSELGYRGIAMTPDVHHLDPAHPEWDKEVARIAVLLRKHQLKSVIESGARFVLDPRQKHQPTLVSQSREQRRVRRTFLKQLADAAPILGTDILSFWSGSPLDDANSSTLMQRLADEIRTLLDEISESVKLAFEPEPGMFLERIEQFAELEHLVNHPRFGLTLDVGHLICTGELPLTQHVLNWSHKLWNVHIEDMRAGVHDHLMFGEGEVPFAEVFAALKQVNYQGGVFVELSRHSHDAVRTARKSLEFLQGVAR